MKNYKCGSEVVASLRRIGSSKTHVGRVVRDPNIGQQTMFPVLEKSDGASVSDHKSGILNMCRFRRFLQALRFAMRHVQQRTQLKKNTSADPAPEQTTKPRQIELATAPQPVLHVDTYSAPSLGTLHFVIFMCYRHLQAVTRISRDKQVTWVHLWHRP